MRTPTQKHNEAMEIAQRADEAKKMGRQERAIQLYRMAMELESEAAHYFLRKPQLEPTRSVLYRSAASLAIDAKCFRSAEQLICEALANEPPKEIRNELRALYEELHFKLFLDESGFELSEGQIVVTLWGNQIAPGFVACQEVMRRLNAVEKLLYRTAARLLNLKYDDSNRVPETVREQFKVYASVPMAASYAIVLRVAGRDIQHSFAFHISPVDVVTDLALCIKHFNSEQDAELRAMIPDVAYYNNFVGLVGELYPTSTEVTHVGIAVGSSPSHVLEVSLASHPKTKKRVPTTQHGDDEQRPPLSVRGELTYANSGPRKRTIKIRSESQTYTIEVPEGMMADVVRPHFESQVVAEIEPLATGLFCLLSISRAGD